MKIIYHHRTQGDGAEGIHIAEMVHAFRQLGNEVKVIGPCVETINNVEQEKRKYDWIKNVLKGPFYEIAEIGYNIAGYVTLRDAVRTFHPDCIYDRYITFNYAPVLIGKKFDIPVFLEVNAPLAYERAHEQDESLFFKKMAYHLESKVCRDAYRTIVVSTPLKEYLTAQGVPEDNILVVPNGANPVTFSPQEKKSVLLRKLHLAPDNFVIGFVGILRPWHGIELLIKAFQKVHSDYPFAKLLIVGDGPAKSDIEKEIFNRQLSGQVVITGRVSHEEVNQYISLFDIAVSPKSTFYASPMKILEYMGQAKPVVAPDTMNIKDIICDSVTGLLFQEGNADNLAKCIAKFIGDQNLLQRIGNNSRKSIETRFNWLNNARYILNAL